MPKIQSYLSRFLAACALAVGAFLGLASTPALAIDAITCTGSETTTFSPPITNQPASVAVSADVNYGPCISTVPGISSGVRNVMVQVTRSCLSLLQAGSTTITINWNNGQSSTAEAQRIANLGVAVYTVTFTGTVTSGVFAGRSFVQQLTAPSTDILLCNLGLGSVSTIDFIDVLEIL